MGVILKRVVLASLIARCSWAGLVALMAPPAFAQAVPGAIGTLATPGGRFVFGQISVYRRDKFMLDTQTGRLWLVVCTNTEPAKGDGGTDMCLQHALEPVGYLPQLHQSHPSAPSGVGGK